MAVPLQITDPSVPTVMTGPATVAGASLTEVARVACPLTGPREIVVTLKVTVAALTGLQLTRCAVPGGAETVVGTDAGLPAAMPNWLGYCLPATNPHTTAAGSNLTLYLRGPGEYVIYAKSAGTAVVTPEAGT